MKNLIRMITFTAFTITFGMTTAQNTSEITTQILQNVKSITINAHDLNILTIPSDNKEVVIYCNFIYSITTTGTTIEVSRPDTCISGGSLVMLDGKKVNNFSCLKDSLEPRTGSLENTLAMYIPRDVYIKLVR
jgi:hypothetical protein